MMHKFRIPLLLLMLSVSLVACLKDKAFMDLSNTAPIIEFSYGTDATSDLGNLGVAPGMTELDTAIAINIASPQVLNYPVTVTLAIDPTLVNTYNNAGNTQVTLLPDSTFSFTTTSVIIPAGHRVARIPLIVYPSKISGSKSYGLPIAIVSAKGPNGQNLIVSPNAGVAFFAFIGNPLAGNYTWNFTRFNGDSTVAPHSSSFTGHTASTVTWSPTALLFPDAYLQIFVGANAGVSLSFSNNNGVLSNFQAYFDPATIAGLNSGGFTITQPPVLVGYNIVGDASTNYSGSTFRFYFQVINSSGGTRSFIDNFVKQ